METVTAPRICKRRDRVPARRPGEAARYCTNIAMAAPDIRRVVTPTATGPSRPLGSQHDLSIASHDEGHDEKDGGQQTADSIPLIEPILERNDRLPK
jgi:hypothetical protein